VSVDVIVESASWDEAQLTQLADTCARATLSHLGLDPEAFEIVVLACDDARIATLNADFRGKPQPTNVLSWPSEERAAEVAGARPGLPEASSGEICELGDIAIAWETCDREAREAGKPIEAHVTHLLVHGILHLLGYDHIRDEDAALMEGQEVAILATMGLEDPYWHSGGQVPR
jgi:probable rRNA maturation factor